MKCGAGDITVNHAGRHAEVTAGSGDIRVERAGDSAAIKASNGDTWVGVADGDLRVRAANGSIAVGSAHAERRGESANGDIRLGDVGGGSVEVETHAGDLEVGIREGTAAWLDLNASAGASTTTSRQPSGPTAPSRPSRCAPAPRSATS